MGWGPHEFPRWKCSTKRSRKGKHTIAQTLCELFMYVALKINSISEVPVACLMNSLWCMKVLEALNDPSHMFVNRFDMDRRGPMCLSILEVRHPLDAAGRIAYPFSTIVWTVHIPWAEITYRYEIPVVGLLKSLWCIKVFKAGCDPSHMPGQRVDMDGPGPTWPPILEVQQPKTAERTAYICSNVVWTAHVL